MKVNCHCEDVDFGTYDNTVTMISPFTQYDICGDIKESNIVCIDTCIATTIGWLWHQGVDTTNSCCGHNKANPWVIVTDESVEKMKKLGYKETKLKCANPNNTFDL